MVGGGLTSPLLFNILYKDLVNELQNCDSGICIGSVKYNIYCYADDLLLSSTTVTGLQHLINKANSVISKIGLKFNPQKTECLIVGNNPFTPMPEWYLNGALLSLSDSLTYLGTCLGDQRGQEHVAKCSQKASKAFYTLQGAGLNTLCVIPETAVRSSLTYVCAAINISDQNLKLLDSSQRKFVKTILGIPYSSRTTPILQSLCINVVSISVKKVNLIYFSNVCLVISPHIVFTAIYSLYILCIVILFSVL